MAGTSILVERKLCPADIHLFKINNKITSKTFEKRFRINKKDTNTRQCCRFGVFIVNFEDISHFF